MINLLDDDFQRPRDDQSARKNVSMEEVWFEGRALVRV